MTGTGSKRRLRSSQAWRDARAVALAQFGRVCRHCGDTQGPFEVDHIVPLAETLAGGVALTNLQVLCVGCHQEKHRAARSASEVRR